MKTRRGFDFKKLIIAAVLFVYAGVNSGPSFALTANEYYKRATQKYLLEDFEGAANDLREALRLEPGHVKSIKLINVILKELLAERKRAAQPAPFIPSATPEPKAKKVKKEEIAIPISASKPEIKRKKEIELAVEQLSGVKDEESQISPPQPRPREDLVIETKKEFKPPLSLPAAEVKKSLKQAVIIPQPKTAKEEDVVRHQITKDETLAEIAGKYLGDERFFGEIAKMNKINDPDLIYAGNYLKIDLSLKERKAEIEKIIYYRVKRGDTLGKIAERYLGDEALYYEIARLNDIQDPDAIYAGQYLKIDLSLKR